MSLWSVSCYDREVQVLIKVTGTLHKEGDYGSRKQARPINAPCHIDCSLLKYLMVIAYFVQAVSNPGLCSVLINILAGCPY